MDKKIVKEAYSLAQKQAEEEKKEKIKNIILETLRKLERLKQEKQEIEKKIKILKKDLEDFKQGRLDLIEERQKVDELAREVSVVRVEKIEHHHYYPRPWYEPFKIEIVPWQTDSTWVSSDTTSYSTDSFSCSGTDFHIYFAGSYQVDENKVINL